MHRIDDPSAVPTLPAPRPDGTPGYFTGGSPGSGGFAATVVRYEFMNALQEELCAIVQAATGMTLDKTNNQQVLAALRSMLRFKLSQDEYLYISPTGNDANDGLTPTTAFLTGQAAWNKALTIDLNNYNLILQFADGTYTNPISCVGRPLGIGSASGIRLVGNLTSPQNVTFSVTSNSCITAGGGASLFVEGISLAASGTPLAYQNVGNGLTAGSDGTIYFQSLIFRQCDHSHIVALGGGTIDSLGNPYTIAAGGGTHIQSAMAGFVANINSAVSLTGNPAFTNAFCEADSHGTIATYGVAYAGAATGKRYSAFTAGLIHTNGGGANYLPGSVAGTVDPATYGIYI